jgi:hypothetical protein
MKTKFQNLVVISENAEKLFTKAADAWTRGNNSGHNAMLAAACARCDSLRNQAEALLAPFGIECDYPGLYPSFKVGGFDYHSVQSALSAAVGEFEFNPVTPKASAKRPEVSHTQERLKVSGDSLVTVDEKYCIATIETDGGYEAPERESNAVRLALCWNEFDALCAIAGGLKIVLEYPTGSMAQFRCAQELEQDARAILERIQLNKGK